jgi:quercetin dioxygenase-like cupin family protein
VDQPNSRRPPRNPIPFVRRDEVVEETVLFVENVAMQGHVRIGSVIVGDEMLVTRSFRQKGLVDPPHRHDDHESIGVLLSGRLSLVIDGEEFVASPGDAWLHRKGVVHSSIALEDCTQIEIKSPPRRTWNTG